MEARNEEENREEEERESAIKTTRGRKIILILDMAQLETVKTKKGEFQLLNCDDHLNIMKKHNKDPQQYRPDILHQVSELSPDSDGILTQHRNLWQHWIVR
jgi:rRNA pseudouridine-1189 N-methylase Emg1 (Nep1/Mra1 family)